MTGRPRSPEVDDAIIRSTLALVDEFGYRAVSMEAIAAHSGVAKQTIYRRYHSKGDVMLDALATFAAEMLPTPDTGSFRDDLCLLLSATFSAQQGVSGELNRGLVVEAIQEEAFAAKLWDGLINNRRQVVRGMIGNARARGEIGHPSDEFIVDLAFGPMWYRLIFGRTALDAEYAGYLADAVAAVAAGTGGIEAGLAAARPASVNAPCPAVGERGLKP